MQSIGGRSSWGELLNPGEVASELYGYGTCSGLWVRTGTSPFSSVQGSCGVATYGYAASAVHECDAGVAATSGTGDRRRKVLPSLHFMWGTLTGKPFNWWCPSELDNVSGIEAQRQYFFFSSWESCIFGELVAKLHHTYCPCLFQYYPIPSIYLLRQNQEIALATANTVAPPTPHSKLSHCRAQTTPSGKWTWFHSARLIAPPFPQAVPRVAVTRVVHGQRQSLTRGWGFPPILGELPKSLDSRFGLPPLVFPALAPFLLRNTYTTSCHPTSQLPSRLRATRIPSALTLSIGRICRVTHFIDPPATLFRSRPKPALAQIYSASSLTGQSQANPFSQSRCHGRSGNQAR